MASVLARDYQLSVFAGMDSLISQKCGENKAIFCCWNIDKESLGAVVVTSTGGRMVIMRLNTCTLRVQ